MAGFDVKASDCKVWRMMMDFEVLQGNEVEALGRKISTLGSKLATLGSKMATLGSKMAMLESKIEEALGSKMVM